MHEAIVQRNIVKVKQLVSLHPGIVQEKMGFDNWLYVAAQYDNGPILEFLVEAGIDVNLRRYNGDTALDVAARKGNFQAAQWLVTHGATIEPTKPTAGGTIIGAVNSGSLELVKLLLDFGADPSIAYGSPPRNALSHALLYGHSAIVNLLKGCGVELPASISNSPGTRAAEIIRHVEQFIGKVQPTAISVSVPSNVDVRIHSVLPTHQRDYITLFTTGMSDLPMKVPPGNERFRFSELLIQLPPNWKLSKSDLELPEHFWPIEWLLRISHYPHENRAWLTGTYAVISNGDPPQPLAPNVLFTAILAIAERSKFGIMQASDGELINFYNLFPIYTSERNLVLKNGPGPLLSLFHQRGTSTVVDIFRRDVAS